MTRVGQQRQVRYQSSLRKQPTGPRRKSGPKLDHCWKEFSARVLAPCRPIGELLHCVCLAISATD